jgi:Protein of unknown function (DUF1501)
MLQGTAGLLGISLSKVLSAEEQGLIKRATKAKSVIFLFLFGGPSQLETFDMKPSAPSEIRGPFRPTRCRTPDLMMCEHLPKLAEISDKYSIVRTMSHDFNDHSGGAHYLQTGKRWHVPIGGGFLATPQDWPSMGAVVEHTSQSRDGLDRDLPYSMVLPNWLGRLQESGQYRRPGQYAGWLGRVYHPLTTRFDKKELTDNPYWRVCEEEELPFQVDGMDSSSGLTLDRLNARMSLSQQFDEQRRVLDKATGIDLDRLHQRALALSTSGRTRDALDVSRESPELRERYGRHLFGQSCLLARRLIEAGLRFVTVHYDCCDGYSWDSHLHSRDVKDHLLPTFDQATAALINDLEERGMLDETLVVAIGEMGRTPNPTPDWGRSHWSTLFPALLAGGGIRPGVVHGKSDSHAAYPIEGKTSPEDLAATIYDALGIDASSHLIMPDGRPTAIVENGTVRREWFA